MTSWMVLALIAGLVALALWVMRVPRALASFVGAAMLLGATGYALTGSPGLPGHAVAAAKKDGQVNPDLVALREQLFGRFTFADQYLKTSDALIAGGNTAFGAQVLIGGLYKAPHDPALWTGLGLALQEHDQGQLSPAAKLAFYQAMKVAPNHPGPPLFYGLALVRTGDFKGTRAAWQRALKLAPPDTQMHREIQFRLTLLNVLMKRMADAEAARGKGAPPP